MSLQISGYVELPEHTCKGGFDHADIHTGKGLLYVAHTANDAIDVIDCRNDKYLYSINNLPRVAGALVFEPEDLVFTSNRGETTVNLFKCGREEEPVKVDVGNNPNGLAYDPESCLLLCGNVSEPYTVSIVDVKKGSMLCSVPVPGRTRWTMFDRNTKAFYININEPARIAVIERDSPSRVAKYIDIPASGPHGLGLDEDKGRLYCACDEKKLITLDIGSGRVINELALSGGPDVVFFNKAKQHLYVAIGNPGVIDVIDTGAMNLLETMETEKGAHTIAFDSVSNKVYAFLSETHRALVFIDN